MWTVDLLLEFRNTSTNSDLRFEILESFVDLRVSLELSLISRLSLCCLWLRLTCERFEEGDAEIAVSC